MSQPIIQLKDISFVYQDGTKALERVNLSIEKGKKVFVHGANGAGKTTLFQCMNGLLKPKTGEIYLKGEKVKNNKVLMHNVGIVFQNVDDQIIAGSVFEELSFGPVNMGLDETEIRNRIEDIIQKLELEEIREKPPHFLSYGQKKRVCIGSVLTMNPEILILDEPFANLDPLQTEKSLNLLNQLAEQGVTLVVACHDVNTTWSMADKIVILHGGEIYREGSVEEIFTDDELLQKVSLNKPYLLRLYEQLVKEKVIQKGLNYPKTEQELVQQLMTQSVY